MIQYTYINMPHLAVETFVSQYFWLTLSLLILYYKMVTQYLPQISETLKAINILSSFKNEKKEKHEDVHVKAIKETLLFKISNPEVKKDFNLNFNNNFKVWSSKL